MKTRFLDLICVAVLCVILTLGLWPFHSPRNEVTWLGDHGGQRSLNEDQAKWFYLIVMKPREGSSRQKHDSFFAAMNLSGVVGIIEEVYATR